MNDGLSIWDKLTRVVIGLLLLAAVLAVVWWYRPVIQQNQNLRQRKLELETQLENQTERGKRLESRIRSMQDPRTIERMAREKLSYAKPGETVIHFDAPMTNTSIPSAN